MSPIETEYIPTSPASIALLPPDVTSPAIIEEQLQASREIQASAAIADLVRAHGLATPGDLMAALGVETVPRLLAMLGFTGDLEGLAREVAATIGPSIANE